MEELPDTMGVSGRLTLFSCRSSHPLHLTHAPLCSCLGARGKPKPASPGHHQPPLVTTTLPWSPPASPGPLLGCTRPRPLLDFGKAPSCELFTFLHCTLQGLASQPEPGRGNAEPAGEAWRNILHKVVTQPGTQLRLIQCHVSCVGFVFYITGT